MCLAFSILSSERHSIGLVSVSAHSVCGFCFVVFLVCIIYLSIVYEKHFKFGMKFVFI